MRDYILSKIDHRFRQLVAITPNVIVTLIAISFIVVFAEINLLIAGYNSAYTDIGASEILGLGVAIINSGICYLLGRTVISEWQYDQYHGDVEDYAVLELQGFVSVTMVLLTVSVMCFLGTIVDSVVFLVSKLQ